MLVIVGLLAGGVLAARDLIRAAELRGVVTEIERFQTALHTFRDSYRAMPGDMHNAQAFWGADSLGCPLGGGATGTCNGNGDGRVSAWLMGTNSEVYRVWQHLALAGLIGGTYSGVPGSAPGPQGRSDVIGTNLPKSPLGNLGWILNHRPDAIDFYNLPNGGDGHRISLAPCCHPVNKVVEGRILRPSEMQNIDSKIDDGKADQGTIQPFPNGYSIGCTTSLTVPADYILTEPGITCPFNMFLGL